MNRQLGQLVHPRNSPCLSFLETMRPARHLGQGVALRSEATGLPPISTSTTRSLTLGSFSSSATNGDGWVVDATSSTSFLARVMATESK